MKDENGIKTFDKNEQMPLPKGLSIEGSGLGPSKYGFKVVQQDGIATWVAATREDFVAAECKRLGAQPSDIKEVEGCYAPSPTTCSQTHCYGTVWCARAWDPNTQHYYCCCCR
jgi:hypothetical protein